jgi:hypothetical protein
MIIQLMMTIALASVFTFALGVAVTLLGTQESEKGEQTK